MNYFNNYFNIVNNLLMSLWKASVTKRRGIGPIRTEISPYKIRKKKCLFFKLLDLTAFVSGKITSVYCQIWKILGQKRHFFAI